MKQQKTVESRVLEILKECPRILYLITEHTDFLVLKPYAGQGREYSPFFLSIHVIRRKKNRAAVFLL